MKVKWSHKGRSSLRAIIEYIAKDDPRAARKIQERIIEKTALLKKTPYLGSPYEMNLRKLHIGKLPYSLYYRITKQEVQVLLVRHERQLPPEKIN